MATKVVMEALSPTMEEGQVTKWLKGEGDKVASGDTLAEVETDKAIMELVARGDGVLRKIVVTEGKTVDVGSLVAVIGSADEDISSLIVATASAPETAPSNGDSVGERAAPSSPPSPPPSTGDRIKAFPLNRVHELRPNTAERPPLFDNHAAVRLANACNQCVGVERTDGANVDDLARNPGLTLQGSGGLESRCDRFRVAHDGHVRSPTFDIGLAERNEVFAIGDFAFGVVQHLTFEEDDRIVITDRCLQ